MIAQPTASTDPAVDVAFAVEGRCLPRDHAQALADALAAHLPWLAGHPSAGVHAIKVVPGSEPVAWLSARARLLLRVPESRAAALAAMDGCTLSVDGHALRLKAPKSHPLQPHGTLYSNFVAAPDDDEGEFMRGVDAELAALGIACRTVCGKRQQRASGAGTLVGFSLLLHELDARASLAVLRAGIGPHRELGCGLFVRHRSAAPVGA